MKVILITLLAFAGSFAYADNEENPMGPNSYNGLIMRLHDAVDTARETLISDLKKSEEEVGAKAARAELTAMAANSDSVDSADGVVTISNVCR
jgi:hypothetical protein